MEFKQIIILALSALEVYGSHCPYQPVCASDGYTYFTACEFRIAQMEDPDLQIMFDGPCNVNQIYRAMKSFSPFEFQLRSKMFLSGKGKSNDMTSVLDHGPLHGEIKTPKKDQSINRKMKSQKQVSRNSQLHRFIDLTL